MPTRKILEVPWTTEDIDFLVRLWSDLNVPTSAIAQRLNRSNGSVRGKARRLKLPNRTTSILEGGAGVWDERRDSIVRDWWPTWRKAKVIIKDVNIDNLPPITREQLSARAAALGVRRPALDRGIAPKDRPGPYVATKRPETFIPDVEPLRQSWPMVPPEIAEAHAQERRGAPLPPDRTQCAWPLWGDELPTHRYCCKPTTWHLVPAANGERRRSSYCKKHHAQSYRPTGYSFRTQETTLASAIEWALDRGIDVSDLRENAVRVLSRINFARDALALPPFSVRNIDVQALSFEIPILP